MTGSLTSWAFTPATRVRSFTMAYTVLVAAASACQGGYVNGWDDPRMPTIVGMRRRGYAAAINDFCDHIGISTAASVVDVALLDTAFVRT